MILFQKIYCIQMKQGLVVKSTGSWFKIEDKTGEIFDCKIKGNFRIKDIKSTNPLAVGDYVKFTTESSKNQKNIKNTGWVISVEDRKNYIVRRSPNLSKRAHIIAANVDQAILLCTISHPVTTTIFIDRYLVAIFQRQIMLRIVLKREFGTDEEPLSFPMPVIPSE